MCAAQSVDNNPREQVASAAREAPFQAWDSLPLHRGCTIRNFIYHQRPTCVCRVLGHTGPRASGPTLQSKAEVFLVKSACNSQTSQSQESGPFRLRPERASQITECWAFFRFEFMDVLPHIAFITYPSHPMSVRSQKWSTPPCSQVHLGTRSARSSLSPAHPVHLMSQAL